MKRNEMLPELQVNNSTASALSLMMINDVADAGYQFKFIRVPALARIEASAGSLTEGAGFIFDFNEHGEIVLAFSLSGQTIPDRVRRGRGNAAGGRLVDWRTHLPAD